MDVLGCRNNSVWMSPFLYIIDTVEIKVPTFRKSGKQVVVIW